MVKATVFNQSAFIQPLNKTRATTPVNSCLFSTIETTITVANQSQLKNQVLPNFKQNPPLLQVNTALTNLTTQCFAGNSPPKYILYKRMKRAIA